MKKVVCGFLALMGLVSLVQADPFYVNGLTGNDLWDGSSSTYQSGTIGPKATIQGAITSTINGDSILVADGTYSGAGNRDIDFDGRAVTLQSQNGPENCIIDCQASESSLHRAFLFTSGEGPFTIIDGFTIKNGFASAGGAIKCVAGGPTIRNCILQQNRANGIEAFNNGGGAIHCTGDNGGNELTLSNCKIIDNTSDKWGGGIYAADNFCIRIVNCLIAGNWAYNYGGAIYCEDAVDIDILNCTIVENSAKFLAGGVRFISQSTVAITNTILWGNINREDLLEEEPAEKDITLDDTVTLSLSFSNVETGTVWVNNYGFAVDDYGDNNIDLDPGFEESGVWDDNGTAANPEDDLWAEGDYQLDSLSNCRNMGDNDAIGDIDTDLKGNDRIVGLAVDIGAYEMPLNDGPDLWGYWGDVSLYDPLVPGDKANALFSLLNYGNETAEGTIGLKFYLSENTLWDENDIELGQINNIRLRKFNSGNSKTLKGKLVVPKTTASGNYYLMAVIDPDNTLLEADESIPSNVILDGNPLNLAWKFGEVDGRKNVNLTVLDRNEVPVTFTLRGGWGEVLGDEQFAEIRLYDTTDKSAFTIKTKGRGAYASVGDIIADGSLNSISAKTTDLLGTITVEGILKRLDLHDVIADSPQAHIIEIKGTPASTRDALSITLGRVTNLSVIAANLPIKTITCTDWLKTDQISNTIETPFISMLMTKGDRRSTPAVGGDFQADLLLTGENAPRDTALNTVKIAGGINSAVWDITGNVGSITAAALQDSSILIGVVADLASFTGQPADFSAQNTLNSLTIKGLGSISFTNSQLAAWEISKLTFPNGAVADGYIQYAEIQKHNAPNGIILTPVQ